MKKQWLGILAFGLLLWLPLTANATGSQQEFETAAAVELGVPFEIALGAEDAVIEKDAQEYFMPFAEESFALDSAALVLDELHKYIPERLREMNLSVVVVASKNNAVIGLASMRSVSTDGGKTVQYSCTLYVSNSRTFAKDTIREILHHEVFHCYDYMLKYKKQPKIQAWAADFMISDYVRKAWSTIDHDAITVDYASEERAEYFAAAILQEYSKFNGQRFLIGKDLQMDEKIARMQEDVAYLMKEQILPTSSEPSWERIWEQGRIKQMNLWSASNTILQQWIFDYETNTVVVKEQQTTTVYPL